MSEQQQKLRDLLEVYAAKTATEQQKAELFRLVNNASDAEIEGALTGMLETTEPDYNESRRERLLEKILRSAEDKKIRKMFPWTRVAAAASIILLLSVGGYFYFNKKSEPVIAKVQTQEQNDIVAPNVTKAMITLSNGQTVALDSLSNGTLATQGDVKVIKNADGEIVYNGSSTEVAYNTLNNPRGSKVVSLTLNDGTKVWLNAESSLKYPVAFVGKERKVEITGEAYFEVHHDANLPFTALANGTEIHDIGTAFNVNSYADDENTKVTLLEGSVKINNSVVIRPGQQAQSSAGEVKVVKANLDEVMGWKEGFFHFESADLKTILKEFGRWYDVEVVYEGAIKNRKFLTIVKRSSTLKSVLEMLQDNDIIYRVEGKKLIVKAG